ncbi:hypothetical protein [Nocardia sp. NPDC005825]|uniref:hypothetical protein n=1 Tax=unclassified Nocardia TaxID=2637762 RepID=UPI0034062888
MQFRTAAAATTLVIGAFATPAVLPLATVPANAQPADALGLSYSTKLVNGAVVTTLKGGTFELTQSPDVVTVKDGDGTVLLTLPLAFHLGQTDIPVKPEVQKDGTVLSLTPDKPAGVSLSQPLAVKPVASQLENDRAMNNFSSQFGLATTIGAFVGTAIGATIGCVATLWAGCLPGFMTGATVGGIIGSIAVGGPVLIADGIDLLTTMQAADGTTKWADKTMPAPTPAQPAEPTQPAN